MRIAVFGAGIAGLMTAIALTCRGHHCTIYERSSPDADSGMGLIIMEATKACMANYGIHLAAHAFGRPLRYYHHRNSEGESLHRQAMPAGALGIRRSELMAAMTRALPPGTLHFNSPLQSFEWDENHRIQSACLGSGVRIDADLFIAADGVRSLGRKAMFPDWPTPQARVLELVSIVRCPNSVQWGGDNLNKFHDPHGGVAFGMLPVDSQHMVWYLQFDSQRFAPPSDNPVAYRSFVNALVGTWAKPITDLLAATDFSKVHAWRPIDADLVPRFHQQNMVLVGDAAHPLLPFTSQGTSAAIADAVALSDALDADSLHNALEAYSIERHADCSEFVIQGRALTQRFLAAHTPDACLLPLAK